MIQTFKTHPDGTCFISQIKTGSWYLSLSETAVLYYKENTSTLFKLADGRITLCDPTSGYNTTNQAKPLLPGESFTITI